jgi:hypothetical protein
MPISLVDDQRDGRDITGRRRSDARLVYTQFHSGRLLIAQRVDGPSRHLIGDRGSSHVSRWGDAN